LAKGLAEIEIRNVRPTSQGGDQALAVHHEVSERPTVLISDIHVHDQIDRLWHCKSLKKMPTATLLRDCAADPGNGPRALASA
jgi:hypothetical protein